MARQCTQPKSTKNSEWFKEKMLLAQALESGVVLDEEQIAFLADPGDRVDSGPDTQTMPTAAIFQTDDLDAFDSDCDEAPSTSVVFMTNLSAYESDFFSDVPIQDTYHDNFVLNHSSKKEIQTLKLHLSAHMDDNNFLTTTVDVLKKETKEKEDKYIEEIVDLEKKKKSLDNIVYKMG
ncbi:hypothetical protein Tco_0604389 [Tanacetum coccineum]